MPSKVIVVLDDLIFTVKITDAAKRAGLAAEVAGSEAVAMLKAKENPLLMIIDLNTMAVNPIKLIQKLKASSETKHVSLLGYISHVQVEMRQRAQDAGCDIVLARSTFVENLPAILRSHATTPEL